RSRIIECRRAKELRALSRPGHRASAREYQNLECRYRLGATARTLELPDRQRYEADPDEAGRALVSAAIRRRSAGCKRENETCCAFFGRVEGNAVAARPC